MGTEIEMIFTKKGRETEVQRRFVREHETDDIDRAKMRNLAILLTKIARRLIAEDPERLRKIKESYKKVELGQEDSDLNI